MAVRLPKKLIVCCDGTWQNSISGWMAGSGIGWLWTSKQRTQTPTNVTRISRAIKPISDDNLSQIVYYQAGIGSQGGLWERLLGGAIGKGLAENVQEAYSFLVNNYVEGDQIYLIGFSRGAYTARAIGGLISDIGLLTLDGLDHFYDIFTDWTHTGIKDYKSHLAGNDPSFSISASPSDQLSWLPVYAEQLKTLNYARKEPVVINAIGVWDTVGALGVPVSPFLRRLGLPYYFRRYRFFDTRLSSTVMNAFQALALDERRGPYPPAVWERLPDMKVNLKQTWFPGEHSDVGGGHIDSGLSNITLAWMMSQLAPFIDFDQNYLNRQFALNQDQLEKRTLHQKTSEKAKGWAASTLENSARGIHALLGTHARKPGRYLRYDPMKDRPIPDQPLLDTNEHIHYSVRSREKTGGLDYRGRFVSYKPEALKGYELSGRDAEIGKAAWKYIGKSDRLFDGVTLPEDTLGLFERVLYEKYKRNEDT